VKFREAARNVTLICSWVTLNIVTVAVSKFKYLTRKLVSDGLGRG
jgi:hypothetical protein